MARKSASSLLTSLDDLFTTQEERDEAKIGHLKDIPLDEISDFPNHPFRVRMDEDMTDLADSIKSSGVLVPALVRPMEDGYQMVAGHRRKAASELAGKATLPCIVRDMTDDEAIIVMVDSNLQREKILPSEKAFAYKMKLDAMKRQQGTRTDLTSATSLQKSTGKTSREILAEQSGESHEQIRKYIRLTSLKGGNVMSISARQVKHKRTEEGVVTDRPGTVYDVFISYKAPDGKRKTYAKRGFPTKKAAIQHEAEMRNKLLNPSYVPISQTQAKTLLKDYLSFWLETYGKANLRPSTYSSYKGMIATHINPSIGHIPLRSLTSENIDAMLKEMSDKRLASSTCRYAQRILSVALEGAIKYHYIERNPARNIMTKFGKSAKTPPPYTIEQVQKLLSLCANGEWEMPVVLSGLYGLRRGEVLGLRWQNIDLKNKTIAIVEQLPFGLAPGTKVVEEMAPTKSHDRTLPITDVTLPYFIRQKQLQTRQKELTTLAGQPYYDNDLVVSKADGSPLRPDRLSTQFPQFLRHNDMPYIRFHDLRHTAATNMHELTGDFYTVGEILGHTLKGVSTALGISTNMPDVTARYVEVRAPRKSIVLETYHNTVFPREAERLAAKKSKDRDAVR